MRKQIMTLTITCILLTGCSKLNPELDSFTMPEKKEVNTVIVLYVTNVDTLVKLRRARAYILHLAAVDIP